MQPRLPLSPLLLVVLFCGQSGASNRGHGKGVDQPQPGQPIPVHMTEGRRLKDAPVAVLGAHIGKNTLLDLREDNSNSSKLYFGGALKPHISAEHRGWLMEQGRKHEDLELEAHVLVSGTQNQHMRGI